MTQRVFVYFNADCSRRMCKRNSLFSIRSYFKCVRLFLVLSVLLYAGVSQAQISPDEAGILRDYLQQGQTEMKANRTNAAIRDVRKALSLDPGKVESNLELGV